MIMGILRARKYFHSYFAEKSVMLEVYAEGVNMIIWECIIAIGA